MVQVTTQRNQPTVGYTKPQGYHVDSYKDNSKSATPLLPSKSSSRRWLHLPQHYMCNNDFFLPTMSCKFFLSDTVILTERLVIIRQHHHATRRNISPILETFMGNCSRLFIQLHISSSLPLLGSNYLNIFVLQSSYMAWRPQECVGESRYVIHVR
jgi:hypothetical protein